MTTLTAIDYRADDARQQFVESLRETGFGVLKNHPIRQELVTSIYQNWQTFLTVILSRIFCLTKALRTVFFRRVSPKWRKTTK